MSYENCGSAHQIEELDHEFDNSAVDLNKLLDQALSRKHTKHDYEDPIKYHFSRYNSNGLIRLHAADKSFNSYEGGSVAELTAVEIHRDENDTPKNYQSKSSVLQNRIDTRDRRPQSDAPLQNIHENSKFTTNQIHTSSAKRLDVLEDEAQDGKVPHYFKDQYQNPRKTSAAKDDYGFSGEFNKNSHSEANQSHPYNNNSLTDSEKISEIMHLAYMKGRGQGTDSSDGGAGVEFMSKDPSMIELSNKDFDNSPKITEEDELEEYKYEESEQQRHPNHHHAPSSGQLREVLVPISQAENESEDSESERIHPSDLLDNEQGQEVTAIDNRKGSGDNKRDEKAMRGQRYPTEVSPASASESIDEFVASRFSGISPRDPRGSITKGEILTEGQLLSSRSQKEDERVETQENRETDGDQLEEEEVENIKRSQSQGKLAVERTEIIHEQSEEEEGEETKRSESQAHNGGDIIVKNEEGEEEDAIEVFHHQPEDRASPENIIKSRVEENETVESVEIGKTDQNNYLQEEKADSNNTKQAENIAVNEDEKRIEENSEVQKLSERKYTLEDHIPENDHNHSFVTAIHTRGEFIHTEESDNVELYFSEAIQKKEAQKETESNSVENKENSHEERIKETGNQGSEAHDISERKETLEDHIQESDHSNSFVTAVHTHGEFLRTEESEDIDQDPSEAAQNKKNDVMEPVQENDMEESIVVSGRRADETQGELNTTEKRENNQDGEVRDTRDVNNQGSEVHEEASETEPTLVEDSREDAQKDSSNAQEENIKTDNSRQLDEEVNEEVKTENKTLNTERSAQEDAQKESLDVAENREENHNEKDLDTIERTQVSGDVEKKDEEIIEEQGISGHENENQERANAAAEGDKRFDDEEIEVPEQKKETEEIAETDNQDRKLSVDEETKEAREDHKKSSPSRGNHEELEEKLEDSVTESMKELEATEATVRNGENDGENMTETQNETDAHTEKLDEKLISVVGSIKEIEGEEGTTVNQDAQIVAEEIHPQQEDINEAENRQNKLASETESVKESEVAAIIEDKTEKEGVSEVQANSSEDQNKNNIEQNSGSNEVVIQETETKNKQGENDDLPTQTQEVKSDEVLISAHHDFVDSIKDSEIIVATQENLHAQAQNETETENLAVQQKEEVENSQERIAKEDGSSITNQQNDKIEKEDIENGNSRPETHPKEDENVNQESTQQKDLPNQTSETSDDNQNSNLKDNQEANQKTSSSSGAKEEKRSSKLSSHENTTQTGSPAKKSNQVDSETKVNSTHNNTIDEDHKSSSEITHNILDMTTQTNFTEVKRSSSNTTSPQKPSVLDHNDKLQINKLLDQIQEEESKENMLSPQHAQIHQEQPTQEVYSANVSTPVKSQKRIETTTASTGTDFIIHKTQIEERGTQTEAVAEEKEAPPIIPIQKVTHFRSLSTTKKKQRSTFRLFQKSVGEYEKDIDFMSKYTTKEVIQNLEHTPEQMEALFESAKKLYKITDETPRGPQTDSELDGILNRVVVARSPVKEGRVDHSLIPIYQQVEETYEDGTRYEGEKFLGKRHGAGTYYYKEGYKFVGNWDQDVMSGFGVLWLNESEKWYEGEWANNVFHGRGSLYNTNPESLKEEKSYLENFDEVGNGWKRYEGQFMDGKRHRFGTILLSNGDVFVGNFRENKAEGRGSYTKVNKKIVVGEWSDNKLKKIF